jgi:acyl-coenzyme A synthetase/AMP-(fatty) acid ligase
MNLFHPNAEIIEEGGKRHTVNTIINNGSTLFNLLLKNKLALLVSSNNFESVFFYINCIERGIVPIIISSDLDIKFIFNIVKLYQPNYIFSNKESDFSSVNFIKSNDYNNYTLWEHLHTKKYNLPGNLALLLPTSGSTGSPKFVRLSLNNLITNAESIIEYLKINKTDTAITNLPINYSYGLSVLNTHLKIGAKIVITNETIIQRKFWDLFNEYKVTSLSGVPYTFNLLKKIKFFNIQLPNLKTITQAGGKLSNELIKEYAEFCFSKKINFYIMYGQTEATARLSYLEPPRIFEKLGSIGKPIPGGTFFLTNNNNEKINEPYIEGQLNYIGQNVMLGYADNASDILKTDQLKGQLNTGDIAYYDSDGYFYIVGRAKRFIKLFGNRLNLDQIENLLDQMEIENACTGTDNKLIVYITDQFNASAVKKFLSASLKLHFSGFEIRAISTIPKNSSGKTQYSLLNLS